LPHGIHLIEVSHGPPDQSVSQSERDVALLQGLLVPLHCFGEVVTAECSPCRVAPLSSEREAFITFWVWERAKS
jgi:hypothetical protein